MSRTVTYLRNGLGAVLTVSSILQLFGLPGDLPTWLQWVQPFWTALANHALNIALLIVGLSLLFGPQAVRLIQATRRRDLVRSERPFQRPGGEAQPQLEITHGIGAPWEVEKHIQGRILRIFRVGVKHDGLVTIGRVHLDLIAINPPPELTPRPPVLQKTPLLPTRLRLASQAEARWDFRTSAEVRRYDEEFPLDAGDTQWLDVVYGYDGDSGFGVASVVPKLGYGIPEGRYELTLRAHGRDAQPRECVFIVERRDGRCTFRPMH